MSKWGDEERGTLKSEYRITAEGKKNDVLTLAPAAIGTTG